MTYTLDTFEMMLALTFSKNKLIANYAENYVDGSHEYVDVGGFFDAVQKGDFKQAFYEADMNNRRALMKYAYSKYGGKETISHHFLVKQLATTLNCETDMIENSLDL